MSRFMHFEGFLVKISKHPGRQSIPEGLFTLYSKPLRCTFIFHRSRSNWIRIRRLSFPRFGEENEVCSQPLIMSPDLHTTSCAYTTWRNWSNQCLHLTCSTTGQNRYVMGSIQISRLITIKTPLVVVYEWLTTVMELMELGLFLPLNCSRSTIGHIVGHITFFCYWSLSNGHYI